MVMLAEVVHVTVYFVSVVVSAVDPVPVHSTVPDELFIFTVA